MSGGSGGWQTYRGLLLFNDRRWKGPDCWAMRSVNCTTCSRPPLLSLFLSSSCAVTCIRIILVTFRNFLCGVKWRTWVTHVFTLSTIPIIMYHPERGLWELPSTQRLHGPTERMREDSFPLLRLHLRKWVIKDLTFSGMLGCIPKLYTNK